jgi:hypothetical protein
MKDLSKWFCAMIAVSFIAPACGGEDRPPVRPAAAAHLRVFVTSVTGTGDLSTWADAGGHTGLAAADAVCQARANSVGLAGTFRAWLSDNTDDAYCRIHNLGGKKADHCGQATLPVFAGPWVRMDGFPFGAGISELLDDGEVYAPVRYDEQGDLLPDEFYFTSTNGDGELDTLSPSACGDWTSAGPGTAWGGNTDDTTNLWTLGYGYSCSIAHRLLCMQTGAGPALPAFAETGRTAFISSTAGSGDLSTWPGAGGLTGLAAGDAVCQARAEEAGLPNAARFRAWLSSSTSNAVDRITTNGPWVRLDGVRVASSRLDLTDGQLFSSINLTQNGYYLGNYGVWTGTDATGAGSASNCSDWTSDRDASLGTTGLAASAGNDWSASRSYTCDSAIFRLYCLED